jgi:hypothetical protein
MGPYIFLILLLLFIVLAKLFLTGLKKYNLLMFVSVVVANLFTVIWLLWLYIYTYKEFKIAALDTSISIVPDIILDILILVFILICVNICYISLNNRRIK